MTLAGPATAINGAGTVAVNWAALTNVVASPLPFHCTAAPDTKPLPETVSVNAAPPTVAEDGLRLEMVGPAMIVNVAALEVAPPEVTVTLADPAPAI